MKSQFIIIPFIHNQPSLNIQIASLHTIWPRRAHTKPPVKPRDLGTYKYEIRKLVLALPPLALPLEQVAVGEVAGEGVRTCTVVRRNYASSLTSL